MFNKSEYYKERYRNDPEYRKKRIAWSSNWNKKNITRVNATNRKRYANRTSKQIKERQQQLRKMRAIGKWR